MPEVLEVAASPVKEFLDTYIPEESASENEYLNEADALFLKNVTEDLVAIHQQYEETIAQHEKEKQELLERQNKEQQDLVVQKIQIQGGQDFFVRSLFAKKEYNLTVHVDLIEPLTGQILRGAAVSA